MPKAQELDRERSRQEISERIRQLRQEAGLTQAQLAAALGVTKNAVTNWESGSARPDLSLLAPLCRALSVSADQLLGCAMPAARLTRQEREHLALYRKLTVYDRQSCDALLRSMVRGYDQAWLEQHASDYLRIPEYDLYFAAGSGHPLEAGTEEGFAYLRKGGAADRADFIVRVSGRSMEPTFPDGCRVLVEKRTSLSPGEIGIFRLPDGDGLIKEYRRDGLHSHNPAYAARTADELAGAVCLGHVLGQVDESAAPGTHEAALLEDAFSARRPRLTAL